MAIASRSKIEKRRGDGTSAGYSEVTMPQAPRGQPAQNYIGCDHNLKANNTGHA
jgi:hypothetical protein